MEQDQETLDDCLLVLETYMKNVTSDPVIFRQEMNTRHGYLPVLRVEVDKEWAAGRNNRPIATYVMLMDEALRWMQENPGQPPLKPEWDPNAVVEQDI
jgi:hypothetical protein